MAEVVTCAPIPFSILGCPQSHPAALLCAELLQEAPCPGAPRAAHSALSAAAQEVAEIRHHITASCGRILHTHPKTTPQPAGWPLWEIPVCPCGGAKQAVGLCSPHIPPRGCSPPGRAAVSPLCWVAAARCAPDCTHAKAGLASSPTSEPPQPPLPAPRSFIKRKHKPEAEGSTFKLLAALPVCEL